MTEDRRGTGRPLPRARRGLPRGWRRALLARRVAAGLLAVLAVVLALRPVAVPSGRVLVARHDVAPGVALTAGDVEVRPVGTAVVPAGALADPAQATGRRPVGPVRAGEALTDVRLVGAAAAVAAAGTPDAAGVPVRLADAAVAALLRPGVTVDVVGAPGAGPGGTASGAAGAVVLASGAVVLDVLPAAERTGGGPVVVLALPGPVAARVAAATLGQEVTVTLR